MHNQWILEICYNSINTKMNKMNISMWWRRTLHAPGPYIWWWTLRSHLGSRCFQNKPIKPAYCSFVVAAKLITA